MSKSINSLLFGLLGSLIIIPNILFASNLDTAGTSQSKTSQASTKIVGGQEAQKQDWPWMAALVFTFQDFTTSLKVDNQSYASSYFSEGPSGSASGTLVNCGIGETLCADAEDKVCLIERGDINFSEKALNCEAGGGVAAIIYNNEEGEIAGTLGVGFNGTIPVLSVTRNDGLNLINLAGKLAEVTISATSQLQQDATCGATFLGDKWVLTAAHCVDSATAYLFEMNVGEYDLSDGAQNATAIKNIYIHPQYDANTVDYDIALVELVNALDAPAVKLASKATTDLYAIENSPAMVAGWGGRTGYAPGEGPTSDFPDILHEVELNLATNNECRALLAESLGTSAQNTGISDRMICATQPTFGKGSCQGDSGGPLVVQTGTGIEQVGIVSWGIGCAETGYPGVFTRVAEFSEWLNTLQTGIAVTQKLDFGIAPTGVIQAANIQLVNNSSFVVDLSFTVSGNNAFSLGNHSCDNLAAGASCELTVNLSPSQAGDLSGTIMVNTNNSAIPTSSTFLLAQVISTASALSGVAGTTNNKVTWYSGGNRPWLANSTDAGVNSGIIGNNQESILSAYVAGKGTFNFQWAVSSEENEEDATDPYDALYLFVNNEQVAFISGEVAFESYPSITLNTDNSIITWVYKKDPATVAGDDKGYVRNVVFTPSQITTPSTPSTSNNSGGGGASGWLSILLLFGLYLIKRK